MHGLLLHALMGRPLEVTQKLQLVQSLAAVAKGTVLPG